MQGDTIFVHSREHQMNIRYINTLPVFYHGRSEHQISSDNPRL